MTKTTKITVLSFFTVLLIAVLCLVLGSTPPLQASAARKTQYISEVMFADDGEYIRSRVLLKDKGYVVDSNKQGSEGTGAFGYKYTTNPDEAITDIKVMNMKGGYSFAEYDEFIKDSRNMATQYASDLSKGIKQYRKGVQGKWPATMFAKKMLNNFREDDSGELLGELLASADTDPDTADGKMILEKIFLQGNGAVLLVIKKAIAYSCLPMNSENWMKKTSAKSTRLNGDLSNYKKGDYITANTQAAYEILESMRVIQKDLAFYTKWYAEFGAEFGSSLDKDGNPIVKTEEEAKKMDEHVSAAFKDQVLSFYELATIHYALSTNAYKDNDIDYVMNNGVAVEIKNLADVVIYSDQIKVEDILPIAEVVNPGNANIMYTTGIVPFITNIENTKDFWDKAEAELKEAKELKGIEVTSVYAGVDRTMFTEDGIAMTNEAMRQNALSPESNPFFGNIDSTLEIALLSAMAVAFVGTLGVGIYASVSKAGWGYNYLVKGTAFWKEYIVGRNPHTVSQVTRVSSSEAAAIKTNYGKGNTAFKVSASAKIFAAAMAVLLIVTVVFLALELSSYFTQERTRIPTAIVDNVYKNKENLYIKYDSVKSINDVDDTLSVYDYNHGADTRGTQWQVVYVTKDKRAGNPITQIVSKYDTNELASYKSVALFGQSAAHSLAANSGFNKNRVYMGFKQDANAYPATGSAFSTSTFILSVCGGVLGGVALGALATWFILNAIKKKKNETQTVKVTDSTSND